MIYREGEKVRTEREGGKEVEMETGIQCICLAMLTLLAARMNSITFTRLYLR